MMATDMLVDLRDFVTARHADYSDGSPDVEVRRATDSDRERLSSLITSEFAESWMGATAVAYQRRPVSAFAAIRGHEVIGFAFYDIAFRGYFGPTGVNEADRSAGIGARLLIAALSDMVLKGYAYAVIGDVGPIEFYEKVCGAMVISKGD